MAGDKLQAPVRPKMSRARKVMIVAIGILFVSEFFVYYAPQGWTSISTGAYGDKPYGTYWNDPTLASNGWEMNSYAWLIIPFLAIVYIGNWCARPFWRNWGYVISLGLFVIAAGSGQQSAPGTWVGIVAGCLAIWATYLNRQERNATAAAVIVPPT